MFFKDNHLMEFWANTYFQTIFFGLKVKLWAAAHKQTLTTLKLYYSSLNTSEINYLVMWFL